MYANSFEELFNFSKEELTTTPSSSSSKSTPIDYNSRCDNSSSSLLLFNNNMIQNPNNRNTEVMKTFPHQFPTAESEEDAIITRAILAVLSNSAPSPPSSPHHNHRGCHMSRSIDAKASAFKRYNANLDPRTAQMKSTTSGSRSSTKRALTFFRCLNLLKINEEVLNHNHNQLASRPSSSTQLQHVVSERRRREKLNESFHSLKFLLPAGTKKDRASVLTTTKEYLSSLQHQVGNLRRKNQLLETQLLSNLSSIERTLGNEGTMISHSSSSNGSGGFSVTVSKVPESSASQQGKVVDLQILIKVGVKEKYPLCKYDQMVNLAICILEFLKKDGNLSVMSLEATTCHITVRLRVDQESDWDEFGFCEAVRRIVSDQVGPSGQ